MTVYSIPALSMENEFVDLDFVGKYVDSLMLTDPEYATVYQWNDEPIDRAPDVVLRRVGATWETVNQA